MVLKGLKLHQFLMVWHERFPPHEHGCRKGDRNMKISAKKAVFLVSSGQKQISPLLAPPRKTFGTIHKCPLRKIRLTPMHTTIQNYIIFVQNCAVFRGITRLDGAQVKMQVWRPHVQTWDLSEANIWYWRKYLWHCWAFLAPPAVILRSGTCVPLVPTRYAPGCIAPPGSTIQHHQCGKQSTTGWQTVHGVFCQTITKSYQITDNIDKILPKFCNIFFIKRFTFTMAPIVFMSLNLFRQNSKFKSGGT